MIHLYNNYHHQKVNFENLVLLSPGQPYHKTDCFHSAQQGAQRSIANINNNDENIRLPIALLNSCVQEHCSKQRAGERASEQLCVDVCQSRERSGLC